MFWERGRQAEPLAGEATGTHSCRLGWPSPLWRFQAVSPGTGCHGWSAGLCPVKLTLFAPLPQSNVAASNAKLALFYDWLFFSPEKDSIMNIGAWGPLILGGGP